MTMGTARFEKAWFRDRLQLGCTEGGRKDLLSPSDAS